MSSKVRTLLSNLTLGFGIGIVTACVLGFPSASWAEIIQFKADLKASDEMPSNQSGATGTVIATYDSSTKQLSWNGNYSGLTGPATAAHIHGPATAGQNARLVLWISANIGQCNAGKCTSKSDAKSPPLNSPFQGSATLTDAQAADLIAGRYYVNIHTDANPAGELRGQLVESP